MKYNIQIDDKWKDIVMTRCDIPNWEGKTWVDYWWRYGCLGTAIANIIQYFKQIEFTPSKFNELMIAIKGYNYLQNLKCEEAKASYIHWATVKKWFRDTFEITLNLTPGEYKEHWGSKFTAKILHRNTNKAHYVNIIEKRKNKFWLFDTEFGDIICKESNEILKLHEFEYLGGIDGII
jgi:hypothetical protein